MFFFLKSKSFTSSLKFVRSFLKKMICCVSLLFSTLKVILNTAVKAKILKTPFEFHFFFPIR